MRPIAQLFPLYVPVWPLAAAAFALCVGSAPAESDHDFVNVATMIPDAIVDLPYAGAENFTGLTLYAVNHCFLRRQVAERLKAAAADLRAKGFRIKVWDGYRPWSVQHKLWDAVPDRRYVANPERGSRHNRGAAIDLTLTDLSGAEVPMPTPYDTFKPEAHANYLFTDPRGRTAMKHRSILQNAMCANGFQLMKTEWWHFDAVGYSRFPLVDVPLETLASRCEVSEPLPTSAQEDQPPPPPPLPAPPGKVLVPAASPTAPAPVPSPVSLAVVDEIRVHIDAVRKSGERHYIPELIYVVDPSAQRMHILNGKTYQLEKTLLTGTGSNGVGFKGGQTPPGFYTMGGVRIAKNASASIQTGDTRSGVSGVYAELLYPPTHEDPAKRGKVPINVVIHSFNPAVSDMLRRRHEDGLIGKVPCTTGCPVLRPQDTAILAPYLIRSAGRFDPGTKPGDSLRALIRSKQVTEHSRHGLGDPIFIINPTKATLPP